MQHRIRRWLCIWIGVVAVSCHDNANTPERTFVMGFQNSAPRYDDFDLIIKTLYMWTERADAAIISEEVPWDSLYAGTTPAMYITRNFKDLVAYYRSRNMKLWLYVDPQNGLDRAQDARGLVRRGKSIADADVQALYQQYVLAADSILHPDFIGLALETNLIRDAAPASIYNGVKSAVTATAAALRKKGNTRRGISIQADQAWGWLSPDHTFRGIQQDLIDFPFIEGLGISSYPYFGFDDPDNIPSDYYSRLVQGTNVPVHISEGGWTTSQFVFNNVTINGTTDKQRRYLYKHAELLGTVRTEAWFQIPFTDILVSALPSEIPDNIVYFSSLGLVDTTLTAKPALSAWDDIHQRKKVNLPQ